MSASKSGSGSQAQPSLQVLWQAVTVDPMDFQSWTALLSQVESLGSIEDTHRAYEGFLRQFPLCFGYWKKYANLARRHPSEPPVDDGNESSSRKTSASPSAGSDAEAAEARVRDIFERAVAAAPFCLELWEAFVVTMMEGKRVIGDEKEENVQDIRRVIDRALDAVGDYPAAGGLWRKCVAFEQAQGDDRRTFGHYKLVLSLRLADLELLWMDFKEFMYRTPWENIAPPASGVAFKAKETITINEGEEELTGMVRTHGDDPILAAAAAKGLKDAERKGRVIKLLEETRKVALRERDRRESFERRITRPHFHVKPLDDTQLSAWSEYLDFEESQASAAAAVAATTSALGEGERQRGRKRPRGATKAGGSDERGEGGGRGDVERLFERCLVPCASYWWLWERYALWKESRGGISAALDVAERACSPFLRWRPEAHFFRAELLERLGKTDEARNIYRRVLSEVSPGLVEGACKLACFERRCGDRAAAAAAYCSLLPPPLGPVGDREGPRPWDDTTETTRPYLYMQMARFQYRIAGDPAAARTTFRAAVADIPGSRELWLAFLEFEAAQPQALHTGRVEAAFRMSIEEEDGGGGGGRRRGVGEARDSEDARRLTVEDRADLWEWFEEFVEDSSMDIGKVMKVRAEHRAWVRMHGAGAHEAAAAAAAGAVAATTGGDPAISDRPTPSSRNVFPAADSKGMIPIDGPRGRGQAVGIAWEAGGGLGASAGTPGAWSGGVGSEGGGGVAGGLAAVDDGGRYAYAQQARDQWAAAYYVRQQQALQQQEAPGGGGAEAMRQHLQQYGATGAVPAHQQLQQAIHYPQQQFLQAPPQQPHQQPQAYGSPLGYPPQHPHQHGHASWKG